MSSVYSQYHKILYVNKMQSCSTIKTGGTFRYPCALKG
jgi:hypothetical protein